MSGRARLGHRRRRGERTNSSWPDTVMARAFLTALARWAVLHHDDDGDATVMLPTGAATAVELARVLRALEAARKAP
jgi:hypothetical protein